MLLDQLWDPDYLERNQVVSMAQHDHTHVASSQKALMLEMKSLQEQPVEGFKITLVNEADMYNWEVAIFGPPNTHYEGGYFKVRVKNSAKCPRNLCSSFKLMTAFLIDWTNLIREINALYTSYITLCCSLQHL